MSTRGRELVNEFKVIFQNMLETPEWVRKGSVEVVEGEWYLFEMEGRVPTVSSAASLADYGYTLESMEKLGFTITPVVVTKIVASR